ncbi:MAG: response regulator [Alicyclobacillus sp.]|nr:response regulator [Alicyclobacillus sp.]
MSELLSGRDKEGTKLTEEMSVRTLLVDDVPETLHVLCMQYSLHPSVEVIGLAKTIQEALDTLNATSINLISIDIYMGQESGLDLCRLVHERFPHIFIIICSVADSSLLRNVAYQFGAHYYTPKPISYTDVCAVIAAYREFKLRQCDSGCVHEADQILGMDCT